MPEQQQASLKPAQQFSPKQKEAYDYILRQRVPVASGPSFGRRRAL